MSRNTLILGAVGLMGVLLAPNSASAQHHRDRGRHHWRGHSLSGRHHGWSVGQHHRQRLRAFRGHHSDRHHYDHRARHRSHYRDSHHGGRVYDTHYYSRHRHYRPRHRSYSFSYAYSAPRYYGGYSRSYGGHRGGCR